MGNLALLDLVQPEGGWYAIVGIKEGKPRQVLVETRGEAEEAIARFSGKGHDVFFGVAKYATGLNRTKDNVLALRSFWLDLDVGEGKPYDTQVEAITALRGFCSVVGLGLPCLVNSGGGVHAYWPLRDSIGRDEWEPVADRLREVCLNQGLLVDPAVFEVARILRVPGTYNYKEEEPRAVEVLKWGKPVDFEDFKETLGYVPKPVKKEWQPSALGKRMMEAEAHNFGVILKKSLSGSGCNQVRNAYENRATLDYDNWFMALSLAAMCEDKDEAIHTLSDGHEGYDPEATEKKAETVKAPPSCRVWKAKNRSLCEGCPFEKLGSPIGLGKRTILASELPEREEPYDFEAEYPDELPEREDEEPDYDVNDAHTGTLKKAKGDNWDYPDPYHRTSVGGIIMKVTDKETGAEVEIPIYANELRVVNRMFDPEQGEVTVFTLKLPNDGIKEFSLPNWKVTDATELRKGLSAQGVMGTGADFKLIYGCVIAQAQALQEQKRAEIMRTQFGWADNYNKFVIGTTEITPTGRLYSPPSAVTENIVKHVGPEGSLDKWKEVWALYGKPGMEPRAFAALSAFGAPLLGFLKQTGAAINLISPGSGTGKTTILNMCNSVWGNPNELRLKQDDTVNAKIMWMGILKNIVCTCDEITNMEAAAFSDFLYAMTQGKGKERMAGNSNKLRTNNTTWQTITVTTSNASFYEKLANLKLSPDGELARFLEYPIDENDVIDTEVGKYMFDHVLQENYGHAGLIYAEWLVGNLEEAKQTALAVQASIDKELKLSQRERFWSATVAANLTGGMIAKRLGLIDWDMKRITNWALGMVDDLRGEIRAPLTSYSQVLGDYINRHIDNILVINSTADRRAEKGAEEPKVFPKKEPKGKLLIRYEPDNKLLFLDGKAFKRDCVLQQVNIAELTRELKKSGCYLGSKAKKIAKGLPVPQQTVSTMMFDASVEDFLDMDAMAVIEEIGEEGAV